MSDESLIEYYQEANQFALDFVYSTPYQPIYFTVMGSHRYGYPSPNSDFDVRGCFAASASDACGLSWGYTHETVEKNEGRIDFVAFDLKKELNLILKNNSNIMEQIFAPPMITTKEHEQLMQIARLALSKDIYNPFHGLAKQNYERYIIKEKKVEAKRYLVVIRSLLAGIHALETGDIESNLYELYTQHADEDVQQDIQELESVKVFARELRPTLFNQPLDDIVNKLFVDLDIAYENSSLPDHTPNYVRDLANDFLIDCRMKPIKERILNAI